MKNIILAVFVLLVVTGCYSAFKQDEGSENNDKKSVVEKTEKAKNILVIYGPPKKAWPEDHSWPKGAEIIKQSLEGDKRLNVNVSISKYWPKDLKAFDGVDSVVILSMGHGHHPAMPHLKSFDKVMKKGVGLVCIHYPVQMTGGEATGGRTKGPASNDYLKSWLGGVFEEGWSVNATWKPNFKTIPKHPTTNGVKPFLSKRNEWFFHLRFVHDMKGVTPILSLTPPASTLQRRDGLASNNKYARKDILQDKKSQPMAWAYERADGGRAYGTTGARFYYCWNNNDYRKLLLNAIVWTAKAKVPSDGVNSADNQMPPWPPEEYKKK